MPGSQPQTDVTTPPVRRYLDNAATSWPKPEPVWQAWERAARENGAAAGRGGYREALASDRLREQARLQAARLLGGVSAMRVALPSGGTLALNMAIRGLVAEGMHVIATAADHNATLRPLHALATQGRIGLSIVPCDGHGRIDPDQIGQCWQPATRLVVLSHASNVTGVVQPLDQIVDEAHRRDGLVLVDAAQTLGVVPCEASGYGADVVVAPTHKWLLGPSGGAVLWAREGVPLEPLILGGTGSRSDSLDMPEAFSERFEAGTPDLPALAGFSAAADWLTTMNQQAVAERCRRLARSCAERIGQLRPVRVLGRPGEERGPAIVSFTVDGYDPAEVAMLLEQIGGVQVRSGYHCAACIHEHLGTQAGGSVRASFGWASGDGDADAVVAVIEQIVAERAMDQSHSPLDAAIENLEKP